MRFIAALSILTDKEVVLTGTTRLRERPMAGLNEVLAAVGKSVVDRDGLRIITGAPTIPSELEVDASTSGQFVSGLMMALGAAGKETHLRAKNPVSIPFITMTLDVMKSFGAQISMVHDGNDLVFTIVGDGYKQTEYFVEPDIMSASYFFAAAAITGHPVFVPGLTATTIQGDVAFVHALTKMGANVEFIDGGIRVTRDISNDLVGSTFDLHEMPDMSLTLAVLGALATGTTTMTSARILQYKESDRSQVILNELAKIGAQVSISKDLDTITIANGGEVAAANIDTYEDHRVAMAFGLLTLINPAVVINDPECVSKTWPEYFIELTRFKNSL
jgi:3-phosphoshikimate 1-carboxyvinyltransferase